MKPKEEVMRCKVCGKILRSGLNKSFLCGYHYKNPPKIKKEKLKKGN